MLGPFFAAQVIGNDEVEGQTHKMGAKACIFESMLDLDIAPQSEELESVERIRKRINDVWQRSASFTRIFYGRLIIHLHEDLNDARAHEMEDLIKTVPSRNLVEVDLLFPICDMFGLIEEL